MVEAVNGVRPDLRPGPKRDWVGLALLVLSLGWIHLASLGMHWVIWTVEQVSIIEGMAWPAWVWPLVALVHAGLLALPLAPLAWFWPFPRYRAAFQTWAVASALILFLIPARFAPPNAAQLAAVLQIAGILLYLAFVAVLIWVRRGGSGWIRPKGPTLPALLLAPLLIYSWFAWGALGSALDVLLNLLAALLFGLAAGLVIGHFLLGPFDYGCPIRAQGRPLHRISQGGPHPSPPPKSGEGAGSGWDITLGGFVAGGVLVMMGSGLGFNGLQLFLMLTLPVLGRTLMVLSCLGRQEAETGWLALALLIGLAAAAPMAFVDPDELVLVLNLGSRDVFWWTFQAAMVSIASTWVVGMVLSLLHRYVASGAGVGTRRSATPAIQSGACTGGRLRRIAPASLIGSAAVLWLVALLIYFLAGQPGFYGERLFVIWEDQADLSPATTVADCRQAYGQRRQYVYETLVGHANASQADIRAVLDRLGIDYTPYYLVNAIEVDAGPLVRWWLGTRPEVDRILDSPVLRPLPAPIPPNVGDESAPGTAQWNLTSIGADRVWREFGVTGQGIVVGQSDSGVQWDHPELKAAYRGRDGEPGTAHDFNWFDPWYHTREPTDISGHGTHTLGSILGQRVGVAPGAQWFGCVNLARNLANPALYLDCMQFMLAPFALDGDPFTDGDPARGAHVINNSWGCPDLEGCDPNALVDAVRALRAAGVFVVASAGNEGERCGSVEDPIALYDESFSVGAVDSTGRVAFFSSRGPVTIDGSNRVKPDILAPGVRVLSAYPGNAYATVDGTSMAGPHVVGVVALMWSANPDLIGDIERTEQILIETARPYDYARLGYPSCAGDGGYPNNAVGYGLVDAYAAVQRAVEE